MTGVGECDLSLPGAAKLAGVTPRTVGRWVTKGVGRPTGRVWLAAVRVGGVWRTSRGRLGDFLAALNATGAGLPAVRTPAQRGRAEAAAMRELERMGV